MAVLTKRIGKAPTVTSNAGVFTSTSVSSDKNTNGIHSTKDKRPDSNGNHRKQSAGPSSTRGNNSMNGTTINTTTGINTNTPFHKSLASPMPSLMDFDSTNPHQYDNDGSTSSASSWANALRYEEQQILRELLGALQGMEGKRIKFFLHGQRDNSNQRKPQQPIYEGIRIFSPALYPESFHSNTHGSSYQHQSSLLGSGAMDALRICGEAGWLYLRIKHFVDYHLSLTSSSNNGNGGSRIARALARAVANELQHYRETLAQWEANLLSLKSSSSSTWSLRKWLIQIQHNSVLHRLTVLAMLVEAVPTGCRPGEIQAFGGGILLSALYKHSLHGDTRNQSIVQSILYPTSQPWFHMLYLWTTQGMLPPSWTGDFFVTLQQQQQQQQQQANQAEEDQDVNSNNPYQQHRTNGKSNNRDKYLWHSKYALNKSQIPNAGIFDPDLVRPAFVVGKGINFIRTCLDQVGWTFSQLEEDKDIDDEIGSNSEGYDEQATMERLGYHYVADSMGMSDHNWRLERTLLRFEKLVHSHILRSLREDHNLHDHLFALKQFMFHGQGDFFSSLLEGIWTEYGCGTKAKQGNANTSFLTGHAVAGVYPYQLMNILEVALRQTNAKDLPIFCLERLKVEMLPFEPERENKSIIGQGIFASPSPRQTTAEDNNSEAEEDTRTVWDVFILDYSVPDPLFAIIHERAVEQYKLVYSFLFGLRKVEYMLNRTWRQSATLQHALQMIAQNNGLQASSSPEYANATILLRKIAMTRQAMTHFCVNLKSYCMLEVLEGGWKELCEKLDRARTLDEAIDAHDEYLEGICRKTLLLKGKCTRRGRLRDDKDRSNNKFRHLFHLLLSIATDFCTLQERLFDDALAAAERVAQRRREAERRMNHGQWGFENEQDLAEEESFLGLAHANELSEVVSLSDAFHQGMQMLLEELDTKVHGRSRNMSATMELGNGEDDDSFDPTMHDTDDPMRFFVPGEEQDVDSLRFLIQQLDHNHYYGLLQRR